MDLIACHQAGFSHAVATLGTAITPDAIRLLRRHTAQLTLAYDGDTGLFHLSSAYTLPKGKLAISLFRDNLDRDPKDVDISKT